LHGDFLDPFAERREEGGERREELARKFRAGLMLGSGEPE
jgi:hypothetical protein